MALCTKNSTSTQGCRCSSIYYSNSNIIDYTPVLSITTTPYSSKVTTETNTDLLPLKQNGVVGYGTCSTFIGDQTLNYPNFIALYGLSSFDGGFPPSNISKSRIQVRCLEDIWVSPFGNAFSSISQNFVREFIRGQYASLSSLWLTLTASIGVPWLFGNNSSLYTSDRRSMVWWWTLPNKPGYTDPPDTALVNHRLAPITGGGFPYKVYSYDSLDFSSYCGLYGYVTSISSTLNKHYYSFNSGVDTTSGSSVTADNSWWIRYFPEISPGSLYIKWPSFLEGKGGSIETLIKTHYLPFYNAMLAPGNGKTFGSSTWIMRIGLEYLKRPGDTTSFTFWPSYMRSTLMDIYSQYFDIKTRILYVTLQQILSSRYSNGSIITSLADNSENANDTIYLAQWVAPLINSTVTEDVSNLSYSLRASLPFLNDTFDPNSILANSNYPIPAEQFQVINTGFTGYELGVSYTSSIRSSTSLIFVDPLIDTKFFGNIKIYTRGSSYADSIESSTGTKTLTQLFGANGEGKSYPRPVPRISRPLPPFNPTDPNIVTPPRSQSNIFNFLNSYTLLYILIGIIIFIIIIAALIWVFIPHNKINNSLPKEYTTGKYGYVNYELLD
jgi:hypothetical protein